MNTVSQQQIEALKYLILQSKNADELAKRVLFLLIEKSNGLTEDVSITLWESGDLPREEIASAVRHTMNSVHGTTHLSELLALSGSNMDFTLHYGHYVDDKFDNTGQMGGDHQLRYTFWLARGLYDDNGPGKHIPFSLAELRSVELKSALYKEQ